MSYHSLLWLDHWKNDLQKLEKILTLSHYVIIFLRFRYAFCSACSVCPGRLMHWHDITAGTFATALHWYSAKDKFVIMGWRQWIQWHFWLSKLSVVFFFFEGSNSTSDVDSKVSHLSSAPYLYVPEDSGSESVSGEALFVHGRVFLVGKCPRCCAIPCHTHFS